LYSGFQLICHFQFNIEWLKASAMVFYTWQAQHASRLNLNFRPTNHLTIIRISRYSNRVDLNKICNCIIWYRNGPSYFGKRKGRFNYNCLNFVSVFHNWTHYGSSVRHAALIISLLLSYFSKRYLFQPSNHKILALHAFFLSYFRKNQNWFNSPFVRDDHLSCSCTEGSCEPWWRALFMRMQGSLSTVGAEIWNIDFIITASNLFSVQFLNIYSIWQTLRYTFQRSFIITTRPGSAKSA